MAGKPYLRGGRAWAATVAATAVVALVSGAGGALAATHYPTGSLCYDCHAVSKSKMVVGTHLIKKSDKTVALGITGSSTAIRCLFCHEKNAVSATGRTEMRGVWDHFDATSTSKHPAYVQSELTPDALRFDCLDCHTGISLGVVSDGAGNARIHGIDAATQTLDLYGTLIGAPANAAAVSTATCQNAACHSAAGSTTGGYSAPARHGFTRTITGTTQRVVTINDAVNPSACTDCHGTHNSYQNTSLITLRTDGTTSNEPGDPPGTRVTPDQCGECHSQDDAGVYANKGHGQSTISGGTVGCTACHSGSVPHSFSRSAPGTNPLRFAFAENTTKQSAIRQQPPYNQVFSVCLTCHSQYSGKEHGSTVYAGCNDCHEPHGLGVLTNVKMIRRQIPKVNASGVPIYGESAPTGTWESNFYTVPRDTTYKTDGTGLCDNAECHQGRVVAGDALYPLSTFLTGGRHSGGDIATGADYDCEACHTHTDDGGSWGAKASCTTCHGQPPPPADAGYTTFAESNTPHQRHAAATDRGGYGYPCQACHLDYTSSSTHNTTTKTYQSLNFDPARNPASPSYTAGTATCNNLYCHSDGQSAASVGSAQWMTGTNTPDWSTQDLACNSCHGGIDAGTRIATGSHAVHLARAGINCVSCHSGTLDAVGTDTTTAIPSAKRGAHANLTKDVVPGGTFNGAAVSFGFVQGADTCSNISCHGGYADVAWTAPVGDCANCHGTFGVTPNGVPLPTTVVAKHSGPLANPDGNENTTLYNLHQGAADLGVHGEGRCDYCHANTQAAYLPAMHIDGVIQLNANMTYEGVSGFTGAAAGCASACHPASAPYQMNDSGLTLAGIAGQGFNCGSCHGDPPATGAHAAHVIDNGDADRTDCANCHSGAAAYTNDGSPNGLHRNGAVNVFGEWDAATTALGVQWSNSGTPADPADDTCTNACHLNDNAVDLPAAVWGTTQLDCSSCHYYAAVPTAAANQVLNGCLDALHERHFGAGGTGWKVCTDCHVVPTPGSGDTTHISAPGAVSDGLFFQDKAHFEYRGEATFVRANVTYTAGPDDGAGPNNRCSGSGMAVGCHATGTAGTADWDVTAGQQCTFCHTDNTTSAYNPVSGLHDETPTISGVRHDNTLDNANTVGPAGCTECHTDLPSTTHHDGTMDSRANGNRQASIQFAADVGYTDAAPPSCAPTGALTLATCHSDGGKWGRIWHENADQATGAECAGCHGTFALGWTAGAGVLARPDMTGVGGPGALTGGHDSDWDGDASSAEISPNHGGCKNCHGMNSQADKEATYLATTMWDPTGVTSAHGDGALQLNGPSAAINLANDAVPVGAEYNGNDDGVLELSDWACTNACHNGAANDNHNMGDSGWPVAYADFGAGACNGCHGYPPLPSGVGGTPGNYADAAVEDYAGGGAGHDAPDHVAPTVTAADGFTPCLKCHPDTSHAQGGGTVIRSNVQVAFPATYNAKSGTAAFVPGASPSAATCTAVSCHGGITTPAWTGAITVNSDAGCRACHKIEAVADRAAATEYQSAISGGHGRAGSVSLENHTAADASLGDTTDANLCTHCHGLPAQHFAGLDTPAIDALTDADFVSTYDGTGGYISLTNGCAVTCHSDTLGGAPKWGRKWSTTITATDGTECANCHGTFALGWAAGAGTLARPSMTGVGGPTALTGPHTANWDGDATADEVSPYHGICKNCHGMNSQADRETAYLATTMWDPAGVQSDHGDRRITINGPSAAINLANNAVAAGAEYNGNDDAVLETSDWACTRACHTGAANANHNMGDSGWALNYKDFGSGSCNGCHGYPPLPSGVGGTPGNYADAAVEDYAGGGAGHDAPDHVAPTVTAADGFTPCLKCHPDTSHAQGGGTVIRSNVQVAFPATYNAKSGTAAFVPGASPSAATCTAVSCHGGITTPAWTGAITVNSDAGCRACHKIEAVADRAAATEYQSAISGGHGRAGSVSLENHTAADASLGDTTDANLCTHCHGLPAQHFAGLDTPAIDALTDADFVSTYDGTGGYISLTNGCAVTCHSDTLGGAPKWGRKWSTTITATDGTECANCHGDFAAGWVVGFAPSHDKPNMNNTANHEECKMCHVFGDAAYDFTPKWDARTTGGGTSMHGNRQITMNNSATVAYQAGTNGCVTVCHANDAAHQITPDSGWTVELVAGPGAACTSCHSTTGSASGVGVFSTSPHTVRGRGTGYTTFNGCDDCHPPHSGGVLVGNNITAGINYTASGRTGFRLGGAATTGTTEAEICWNCHNNATYGNTGANAISEWGTNNKQAGAPSALAPYNYGTLSTPNWTTATWTSAQAMFAYKTGAIQSTHSVNSAGTSTVTATSGYYTETKDTVANIRCSYCHDVHDTAAGVVAGDVSGKPYLRGTWWTNPYKEDGAPTGAWNYYTRTDWFGGVPRGWYNGTPPGNTARLGGWQIDQNNNSPTVSGGYTGVTWTTANSAGLCLLCHTADANENYDQTTGENLWVGAGHSNAVIGGTGTQKYNIYSPTTRNEGTSWTNPKMGYQMNATGGANGSDRMYGLRNYAGNSGWTDNYTTTVNQVDNNVGVFPYAAVGATTTQVRYAYRAGRTSNYTSVWGVDQSTTTAQTKYHNFSCSKCHNPHASRLPKLMITNCLDVSHNTWDDNFSVDVDWTSGGANGAVTNWSTVGIFPTGTESAGNNKEFAYAKSAQNCHRFIDNNGNGTITTGDTGGDEPGWNKVTPWK